MQVFDTSIYMSDDDKNNENAKGGDDALENVLEPQLFQGPLIWAILIFVPIILILMTSVFSASKPQGEIAEAVEEAGAQGPEEEEALYPPRYDEQEPGIIKGRNGRGR